ncbi:MAG: protein BatD [Cryomorphaceae bacterium]|nr:protein BatD [Cryomorphaceae bacterium]
MIVMLKTNKYSSHGIGRARGMLLLLGVFLFLVSPVIAQNEIRFVGKASANKVGTEEKVTITYTLNDRGQSFRPPENLDENFIVLTGPNQSIQSTMTNHGFQTTLSVSYALRPKNPGKFTLGPARVMVKGAPQLSNPIEIEVVSGRTKQADPNDPEQLAKTLSWIKAILNKTTVYVGEPIRVNYKLYFKSGVENPRFEEEPSFKGFIVENIAIDQVRQEREFIDNEQVITAVIKSFLLFPQQPGTYDSQRIPVTIPTTVPTQRRDSWFFGNYSTRVDNNTTITLPRISVKPLPVDLRPDDFTGGVGRFTLDVDVNKTELEANQSLTVKLTLRGSGNIRLVDIPKFELPPVFESYEPKTTQSLRVADNTVTGSKTAEYLLIPRYSGTFEIPSISMSYFNPASRKYETIKTEPISIEVSGDARRTDVMGGGGLQPVNKEQVGILSKDIMFIKTTDFSLMTDKSALVLRRSFWIWFTLIIALFPISWLIRNLFFKHRMARGTRLKKAEREVEKLLAQARNSKSDQEKISCMHRAMEGYFSARLKIDRSEFQREAIIARSVEVFDEAFTKEWLEVFDTLESLQYGGPSAMKKSISKVEETIKKAQQWV